MTEQAAADQLDTLAAIAEMMAASARHRADRRNRAWTLWRPYERRLVREAAVMGYVLGHQSGRLDGYARTTGQQESTFPDDTTIVRAVVEHCISDGVSDHYPYIAAAGDGRRRRVTRKRAYPGEFPDA